MAKSKTKKSSKKSVVRVAKKATPKAKRKSARVIKTPKSIRKHQSDYRQGAWMEYTQPEIAEIVAYKAKLATHYTNKPKSMKAIRDAHNYLDMLEAKIQ